MAFSCNYFKKLNCYIFRLHGDHSISGLALSMGIRLLRGLLDFRVKIRVVILVLISPTVRAKVIFQIGYYLHGPRPFIARYLSSAA
jgi:hypothetical protein